MFDRQKFLDDVIAHFIRQRRQAKGLKGCRYRMPNGLSCAIGSQISDDEYDPRIEDLKIKAVLEETSFGHVKPEWVPEANFLRRLQTVHDEAINGTTLLMDLRQFAQVYNLKFVETDEIKKLEEDWNVVVER